MTTTARMKASKIIKLEGMNLLTQLPSLPHRVGPHEPLCSHSETRVGAFLDGLAGKRFQILDLRGRKNNEKLPPLLGGLLRLSRNPSESCQKRISSRVGQITQGIWAHQKEIQSRRHPCTQPPQCFPIQGTLWQPLLHGLLNIRHQPMGGSQKIRLQGSPRQHC